MTKVHELGKTRFCSNCAYAFWHRPGSPTSQLECRRFPPHQSPSVVPGVLPKSLPYWPFTLHGAWCGEHELREDPQATDLVGDFACEDIEAEQVLDVN